jgi:hypothetical protein
VMYHCNKWKRCSKYYDYMTRLADLKSGQKVKVTINRDDDEIELILEL